MSIIKCEECEKMIDSDFNEIESVCDKEYCQECYLELQEAAKIMSKLAIKHMNATADFYYKELVEKKTEATAEADVFAKNIYNKIINHKLDLLVLELEHCNTCYKIYEKKFMLRNENHEDCYCSPECLSNRPPNKE